MSRKTYRVTTTHPTGYMDGTHDMDVTINPNGTRYVKATGLGCSRDYSADSDTSALRQFLAEHAMTLVRKTSAR